jgi:integrase/recombinase XerD
MAKNDAKVTDNPKLKEKILSDGQISLYLEYYLGYDIVSSPKTGREIVRANRHKEYLNLYIWQAPRTPIERNDNKKTYELARKIRAEREQEMIEQGKGYRLKKDGINFLDYFQAYIDSYTKKDIRMVKIALQRFKDFFNDTKEYNFYTAGIKPEQITKDMIEDFTDYLKSRSKGEGAKSIYARFKKVINYAIDHDVMIKNPCKGVSIKVDETILRKDVLSPDEELALMECHYKGQNLDERNAFLLCLYCGLRWCDVKDLCFSNVDYGNKLLKFEQNKTKGHSANSGVIIPLSDDLLELIGTKSDDANDDLIFHLPTYWACKKALEHWVERAGITKHITWHCARHSFAVNILNAGANIKTVASLLGHSGLRHTEKYTRAVDSLKRDAINSLPKLKM